MWEGKTMKLSKKFIAVPAIAIAAGLGVAACGSSQPAGYLNSTTLQNAIDHKAPSYMKSQTTCVPNGTPDQFNCSTTSTESNVVVGTATATVTVSSDGKTWVASNIQSGGN